MGLATFFFQGGKFPTRLACRGKPIARRWGKSSSAFSCRAARLTRLARRARGISHRGPFPQNAIFDPAHDRKVLCVGIGCSERQIPHMRPLMTSRKTQMPFLMASAPARPECLSQRTDFPQNPFFALRAIARRCPVCVSSPPLGNFPPLPLLSEKAPPGAGASGSREGQVRQAGRHTLRYVTLRYVMLPYVTPCYAGTPGRRGA